MFDCHYDLLTHILMKKNKKEELKEYCKKVYKENNITGGIFNLFYMSEQEMKDEIGIPKNKINLINNLKEVKKYIESNKLIDKHINYIFGIEGLDYLEKIEDIDTLYNLGVRSTNPVWNNKNKFGGGTRADDKIGLSILGEELVKKLVEKRIAIDLSHANEKTFFDIINLCKTMKKQGKQPIVFASHSNARKICDVPRNLTDEQILAIKELDGVIGIASIKGFCINTKDICNPKINFEQEYINHINYVKCLLGGVDNIVVSTDDMKYYYIEPEYYQNINIFPHHKVKQKISEALIKNNYEEIEIKKILENNFKEKILNKLK